VIKMDFKNFLTPRGFLSLGGVVLLAVGILGFIGVIGPTPDRSIFGDAWWFDNAENVAHTVLGIVALLAVTMMKDAAMQKMLVLAVGAFALLVGLYNLGGEVMLAGATLQNPMDTVLHLVVGAWGLYAGLKGSRKA